MAQDNPYSASKCNFSSTKKPFSFEENGFDFIRYFAAFSVMMLHYTGYSLMLCDSAAGFMRVLRRIVNFFPGVVVLFSLSGFLVAASEERTSDRRSFFQKRVLRMYPELWCCTLVNLLVVLCLASPVNQSEIIIWLFTQILGIANTPSSLKTFATGSLNGALWTIFTEIQLYVLLGFLAPLLRKMSLSLWGILLTLAGICNLACYYFTLHSDSVLNKVIERSFIPYAIWFLIGAFLYYHIDWVAKLRNYTMPLLTVYLFIRLLLDVLPGYYTNIGVSLLCPVLTILIGYKLPAIRLHIDLSYGMFLYHWIILNIIVYFNIWNRIHWIFSLFIFITATLLAAWISRSVNRIPKLLSVARSRPSKTH